jgi:hypothetical protein
LKRNLWNKLHLESIKRGIERSQHVSGSTWKH